MQTMKSLSIIGILFAACVIGACNAADTSYNKIGPQTKCDSWEKVLSEDEKSRTILLVEDGCSGLVNSVKYSVVIASSGGHRVTVFKYDDASWSPLYHDQTTLTVEWLTHNRLRISIGAVEAIEMQLSKTGDIDIEYRINHVLSKEAPR